MWHYNNMGSQSPRHLRTWLSLQMATWNDQADCPAVGCGRCDRYSDNIYRSFLHACRAELCDASQREYVQCTRRVCQWNPFSGQVQCPRPVDRHGGDVHHKACQSDIMALAPMTCYCQRIALDRYLQYPG